MILLDTNVVSEMMKETGDPSVLDWFGSSRAGAVWLPAIVLEEVWFGLRTMDLGKRQRRLFDAIAFLEVKLPSVPFDDDAAKACAIIRADCERLGRRIDLADAQIAGTAKANHATLATRNVKHFVNTDLPIINPWDHP